MFQLLKDGLMNKNISNVLIQNTANQIAYKDYSNSSNNYSGFFSYSQEMFLRLFPVLQQKRLNKKTLLAIEESKHLEKMVVYTNIDDLFKDLEN